MDQAAPAHQAIHRHQRERSEEPDLVRGSHLRADFYRQEGAEPRCPVLHLSTDSVRIDLRENRAFMRLSAISIQK